MNKYWLFLLFCLNLYVSQAQAQDTTLLGSRFAPQREKIEKARKELIADRINLSADQAKKFWPVYDQYIKEKLMLRRKMRLMDRKGANLTASDQELMDEINERINLRQQELDLDKKTKDGLAKIISVRQLAELYRTEKEFLRQLMQILTGKMDD
jgi:Spy/CpxP family protein refolding chaperone